MAVVGCASPLLLLLLPSGGRHSLPTFLSRTVITTQTVLMCLRALLSLPVLRPLALFITPTTFSCSTLRTASARGADMPSGFSKKIGARFARAPLSPGVLSSESGASVVTALASVGRTPGTRSRRGVHHPQNHLAWLALQLQLFPPEVKR